MSHKTSQQGSVLAVVSVAIVILLVAVLGYVLYQNVSKPTATERSSDQTATEPMALSETAETTVRDWTIALKHPMDWTVERSSIADESIEATTTTISNKSKSMSVEVMMNSAPQLGGACSPGTTVIAHLKREVLTGAQAASFQEVTTRATGESGQVFFHLDSGLVRKDTAAETAITGDDACKLDLATSDYFAKTIDGSSAVRSAVRINVAAFDDSKNMLPPITEQAIRGVLASDDYKTAVRIVQSYSQK